MTIIMLASLNTINHFSREPHFGCAYEAVNWGHRLKKGLIYLFSEKKKNYKIYSLGNKTGGKCESFSKFCTLSANFGYLAIFDKQFKL